MKHKKEKMMIEVYNIDIDICKIDSSESLNKFLSVRIENKINSKIHDVQDLGCFLYFVVVLWGDIDKLLQYKNVFKELTSKGVWGEIMTLSQYKDSKNNKFYQFETVISRLNKFKKYYNESKMEIK